MEIKLYEYGLDNCLLEAEKLLRACLYVHTGKKNQRIREIKIAEAYGIIEAARSAIVVNNPEQNEGDTE